MLLLLLFIFGTAVGDEWELIWEDNFNFGRIDQQNWKHEIGDGCDRGEGMCGWGNNELQYYTDSSENSYVENGHLVIKAVKESKHNSQYTSARLITKGKAQWRFGKFQIRAKMPQGSGLWPAIWMLPCNQLFGIWPRSGEIVIVETLGHDPKIAYCAAHYGEKYNNKGQKSTAFTLSDGSFTDDFHNFEIIWETDKITWYIDGNKMTDLIKGETEPFFYPFNDDDFFLILNLAVGGNFSGAPKADTVFPAKMEVDYVKVYRNKQ